MINDRARGEAGSTGVVLVAVLAVAMAFMVGFARLGIAGVHAARAQHAADLAALGGAQGLAAGTVPNACGSAGHVATANGAHMVRCEVRGWSLRVVVRYASVTRSAAAALRADP